MTTKVEKSVVVNVPVFTAYNQWTQFEDFPRFMGGITSVTQLGDDRLEWVAEIAGVRRRWEAKVLEQVPDRRVSWAATEGATNAGEVTFEQVGPGQTSVHLTLEYEPEGLVEKVGDRLNVVENQAEADLDRFKAFIESESYATGAWRGSVNADAGAASTGGTPNLDDASASRGDSGKAGVTGKAVAAGVGVAAAAAVAGVAAAASAKGSKDTGAEAVRTETTLADSPAASAPPAEAPPLTPQPDVTEPSDTIGTIPARVVPFEEVSGPTEAEKRRLDEDADL